MSETAAKKDVQRLQRTIVDALEDVKAIDIRVFNTEHLSPLFERVIIASGQSNRQTKALAASVRDKVREAGFGKPRIEGEDNGEWIIADCGAAVVHIMQPSIRIYYSLEEIWGDKPVRLKSAAPLPTRGEAGKASDAKTAAKPAGKSAGKSAGTASAKLSAKSAGKPAAKSASNGTAKPAKAGTTAKAPARKASAKTAASGARSSSAAAKAPARKAPVNTAAKTAAKAPAKAPAKTASKAPAKAAAKAPRKTAR
jgi:ribosome-associated protein